MLRDLGLQRVSNSVCGRHIQKESSQDNVFDITDDDFLERECNMSNGNKLSFKLPASTDKLRKDRGRMTVKVLDAVECVHAGVDKYIPFARRLHSWTTIKVSS